MLLCLRHKKKTDSLWTRCPMFRWRRHLYKQWKWRNHVVSWCAHQNWMQFFFSKFWLRIPSVRIFHSFLLGCVWGSGGESCGCQSRCSYWLFCVNYHPPCADLAATAVSCRTVQYWDEEMGMSESLAEQLSEIYNASLSKYLSSGGIFGSGCHLSVYFWLSLLFVGRFDGRMLVSGMSIDAFE